MCRLNLFRTTDSGKKAQPLIVNLDDELAPGLGIVLQYLYSLRLPAFNDYTITFDTALAVLKVSGKFAIPELRDEACRYLEGVCERWLERNEWSNGKNKSTSNYLETFREIWKLDFVGADKLRSALVIAMAEQSPELILLDEFENWLREDMDFNMAFMKAVCKAIRKRRYELAKT